jgi:hypothetical protein
VGGAHPGLDCSQWMRDRFTTLPHFLWSLIDLALNGFENVLV